MAARGRSGVRGAGCGGHLGSGRVPPPVPGRRSWPGGVRPGDDGGAAAVWVLPGRAVQPGDRKAVRAGCGLPGDHRRAASRSCDHRPVPGPARGGAGRAVQPGAAAAGRRGHGVAGPAQPGWHQAGRQRGAEGEQDAAADREASRRGGRGRRRRRRPATATQLGEPTPRTLARRAERRERLAAPGTGWRPRTRPAATRSGPGRRRGTLPRRPGNGAGTAPATSRRARTATTPSRGRTSPTRTCG